MSAIVYHLMSKHVSLFMKKTALKKSIFYSPQINVNSCK